MGYSAKWKNTVYACSEALLDASKYVTKQGETMLINAAEKWLDETDSKWPRPWGSREYPWFTGSLHDSISVRISDNNRTIAIRYMNRAATGTQSATEEEAGRDYEEIIGWQFGRLAAGRASRVKQTGLQAHFIIGVPYAVFVDNLKSHRGYINDLWASFISSIEDVFLGTHGIGRRKLGTQSNLFVRNR